MLGVATAFGAEPSLLLLDEPLTGMNADEIKAMIDLIKDLQLKRAISLMLVEHNVKTVMDLCQRIIVLNFGRKIAEGSPDEIRRNKDVIEAYLGKEVA
jgi:branched-chain amino acid transport system ATP-binding protein